MHGHTGSMIVRRNLSVLRGGDGSGAAVLRRRGGRRGHAAHELFDVAHLAPRSTDRDARRRSPSSRRSASMPPTPGGPRRGCNGRRSRTASGAHPPADGGHHELGGDRRGDARSGRCVPPGDGRSPDRLRLSAGCTTRERTCLEPPSHGCPTIPGTRRCRRPGQPGCSRSPCGSRTAFARDWSGSSTRSRWSPRSAH